mgnify:CR=1 FL=1
MARPALTERRKAQTRREIAESGLGLFVRHGYEAVSVEQIMTADVVTVGPDWDLVEAAKVMASRRIRHLVVYEGGQLLGVLSVRDVLPAVLAE